MEETIDGGEHLTVHSARLLPPRASFPSPSLCALSLTLAPSATRLQHDMFGERSECVADARRNNQRRHSLSLHTHTRACVRACVSEAVLQVARASIKGRAERGARDQTSKRVRMIGRKREANNVGWGEQIDEQHLLPEVVCQQ